MYFDLQDFASKPVDAPTYGDIFLVRNPNKVFHMIQTRFVIAQTFLRIFFIKSCVKNKGQVFLILLGKNHDVFLIFVCDTDRPLRD